MGLNLQILKISANDTDLLESFIDALGNEQISFRYFKNRSTKVLENHVYTCLAMLNNVPVGYGHLDSEDGVIWLGIVVKEEYQGKGIAKRIMEHLLQAAKSLDLSEIQLAVDNVNHNALKLYERFGFSLVSKSAEYSILTKKL